MLLLPPRLLWPLPFWSSRLLKPFIWVSSFAVPPRSLCRHLYRTRGGRRRKARVVTVSYACVCIAWYAFSASFAAERGRSRGSRRRVARVAGCGRFMDTPALSPCVSEAGERTGWRRSLAVSRDQPLCFCCRSLSSAHNRGIIIIGASRSHAHCANECGVCAGAFWRYVVVGKRSRPVPGRYAKEQLICLRDFVPPVIAKATGVRARALSLSATTGSSSSSLHRRWNLLFLSRNWRLGFFRGEVVCFFLSPSFSSQLLFYSVLFLHIVLGLMILIVRKLEARCFRWRNDIDRIGLWFSRRRHLVFYFYVCHLQKWVI